MRQLRRALALLVVTAAAATVPLVTAAPASAAVSARVFGTDGAGLNVRTSPSPSGAVRANLPENTYVSVSCQTSGTTVNGTAVWDYLPAYGGYASDAYLWTGYDGFHPQLPRCGPTSTPPPSNLRSSIVSLVSAEVGNGHLTRYGGPPQDEWCSYFATWAWRSAGVDISNYGFTGDVFRWGQDRNLAFWGTDGVRPGDVVLYGTGPQTYLTSTHIGVVTEVRSDGTLVTVEGNFNDAVTRVGPRYPSTNSGYGSVYGYVRPGA